MAFNGYGLPQDNELAPARRLISELQNLSTSIGTWRSDLPAHADNGAARLVEQSLRITLEAAANAAEQFEALIGDTYATIQVWHRDRSDILQELSRLDWLLDGWETILGIWNAANASDKNIAIMEMAVVAPILAGLAC
jgi:hypothetical protein